MAVVENRFVCDLSKPVQAQALKGNVFSLDNLGSRISVLIYDNGQPATISGSITANCILPDGSTVNVNGGLTTEGDGSKAYVDVPQSCLLIPGILKIAIKCTSSSVITTLAAIVANVYMTKTDNVITPSQQIIADWNAEISAAIATQNAAIANQDTKIDDLKSALGFQHYELTNSTNKELCKLYPVQGHRYCIYGNFNSYVTKIDFYEFYTDGTTETKVKTIRDGQLFEFLYTPTSAYVNYLRLYVTVSGGTGETECMIIDLNDSHADLFDMLSRMFVSSYGNKTILRNDNNCLGYTDVASLPGNTIWSISEDVTSSMLANLPTYGETSVLVSFSARPYYTDNRSTIYLYMNTNSTAYIGLKTIENLYWKEITNDSVEVYNDLFGSAQYYEKNNITSNTELTKFYIESGKEYDVVLFNVHECDVVLYEFDSNGDSTEYGRLKYQTNGRIHYKPTQGTVYLRLYCRYNGTGVEIGSANAAVLESENVLSYVSNRSLSDATDYLLSKEFSAVRKFTVIGDSLASGYYKDSSDVQHGRNLDYSWPQVMGRIYGQQVQNATQSGATTKTWWEDPHANCKAMVTASKRSQVYIVGIGTNDYKDITPTQEQIGSSDDIDETDYNNNADTFWGNYCKILQYVHDIAPDAKIICLTVPIPPRPREDWKQEAIRGICAYPLFSDYVVLCDLDKYYADLLNSPAMRAEVWHSHYTPVGYANSVELLMYAFSKTIQQNLEMFVDLPQIPFDPLMDTSNKEQINETITTPAEVQSFPDGADGLPMALTVGIEPVQDLHGYENPWPAGGRVNQFDLSDATPVSTPRAYNLTVSVDEIEETITVSGSASWTASGGSFSFAIVDVTKNYTGLVGNVFVVSKSSNITSVNSMSYSNGAIVINVTVTANGTTSIVLKISFAETTQTAWTPYSNICPISGWTGANVTRTGVNIWDEEWENGIWDSTGEKTSGSSAIRSKNYIPVAPSETYYLHFASRYSSGIIIRTFDENKTIESTITKATPGTFVTTSNAAYIAICTYVADNITTYANDISINYPSTDTQYHAYSGDTYPVTFPTSAGTVYGGMLTVNKDGSGSLVVDRAKVTYDGDEEWSVHGTFASWFYRNMESDSFVDENRNGEAISDSYAWDDYTNVSNIENGHFSYGQVSNQSTTKRIVFKDTNCTTVAEWEAYLAQNPVTVIYRLATTITSPLAPEQVKTLLGVNNVWADTGNITEIQYPADIKLYIDKKLAELSSANTTALGT